MDNNEPRNKPHAIDRSISEKAKRTALALAFGIVIQGGFVTGIPGGVPGLSRAITCSNCTMKLSKGIPTQFSMFMTDEQKKAFKQALRDRKK